MSEGRIIMISKCQKCDKLLKEGDRVRVQIKSNYHVLKSQIAFALDKNFDYIPGTLEHDSCPIED